MFLLWLYPRNIITFQFCTVQAKHLPALESEWYSGGLHSRKVTTFLILARDKIFEYITTRGCVKKKCYMKLNRSIAWISSQVALYSFHENVTLKMEAKVSTIEASGTVSSAILRTDSDKNWSVI